MAFRTHDIFINSALPSGLEAQVLEYLAALEPAVVHPLFQLDYLHPAWLEELLLVVTVDYDVRLHRLDHLPGVIETRDGYVHGLQGLHHHLAVVYGVHRLPALLPDVLVLRYRDDQDVPVLLGLGQRDEVADMEDVVDPSREDHLYPLPRLPAQEEPPFALDEQ